MAADDMTDTSEAATRKVEIEDLYRFRLLSDPQVSPDGRAVAYVQTRLRKKKNDYASNIWLLPLDGAGEPGRFTGSDKRDYYPRWSPDGSQLAFISTRSGKPQAWVIRAGGGEARQLTRSKHPVTDLVWSPDGKWIVFVSPVDNEEDKRRAEEGKKDKAGKDSGSDSEAREPGYTGEEGLPGGILPAGEWEEDSEEDAGAEDKGDHAKEITWMHFKADGAGLLERRQHLFIVPSKGGTARQLTEGDWNAATPRWSPDGRQLAYIANQEADADYFNIQDIFVLPIDEEGAAGEQRRVTDHDCAIGNMEWLRDGSGFVVFAHSRIQEAAFSTNMQVWTVSLTGMKNRLTEGFDRSAANIVNSDLRSAAGELRPRLSADGSTAYFMVTNGGACQVFSVPTAGGEVTQVVGGNREVLNFSVAPGGIVFVATEWNRPNDLYFAATGGEQRRLTDVNADIVPQLQISEPEQFELETAPGVRVEGWILKPPGFDPAQKYPLIVEIHGGPHTSYGYPYFHEFQVLAARGYVVLYTNPRGSQGYGQEFSDAIISDWGGVDYEDIMACVDHVVGLGYVDEERLGVTGGSYGGYMTGWIIGHTQRFKAAVASRMVSNLHSAWGSGDFTWRLWNFEMEGDPYKRTELYIERSPVTYAHEMRTPLLITHAADDLRCNIEQADQMYTALKVLKRDVKMVRFPSGGHDISRSGKPTLRVERLQHIAGWFDKYLQPDSESSEEKQ
ncbi:MAG TPA: S9 family peptidase [Chloroflexia bacterium]|nr:S9 family peptidase [Chloroflexia bacterium]